MEYGQAQLQDLVEAFRQSGAQLLSLVDLIHDDQYTIAGFSSAHNCEAFFVVTHEEDVCEDFEEFLDNVYAEPGDGGYDDIGYYQLYACLVPGGTVDDWVPVRSVEVTDGGDRILMFL